MKSHFSNFAKDTQGMVTIDWIGIAAGLAISASSAISYMGDHVMTRTNTMSTSIKNITIHSQELHIVDKNNHLEAISDDYPPQP